MHNERPLFDRAKPFYPFIMSTYSSMHGMLDLISRKAIDVLRDADDDVTNPKLDAIRSLHPEVFINASKTPFLLSDKMALDSSIGLPVEIEWSGVETEIYDNSSFLMPILVVTPLRMLLVNCYEATKEHFITTDPTWHFFRHCRNAAAHNGHFYFANKTNNVIPKATWVTKEITISMQGYPLLVTQGNRQPFLKPGDIFRLLYDIENMIRI